MKTLIVYASKYGFTKKCVDVLKEKIKGQVDVLDLKEEQPIVLSNYNQIVIGGPIYVGKVHKSIRQFCDSHVETLRNKRIGLFLTCAFSENFQQQLKNSFPSRLIEVALVKKCFGGEMNITKMKLFDRIITNMVRKMTAKEEHPIPMMMVENIDLLAKGMNVM